MAASADLTLVPLPATLKAHLRARDLPRLRASGPLGRLLAAQSQARGDEAGMRELARAHPGLPDDLLNFHHDPLTCAVALSWPGAAIETLPLLPVVDDHVLRFQHDQDGRPTKVAADLDAESFPATWLAAVEAAQTRR